jgi:hypothetical protein
LVQALKENNLDQLLPHYGLRSLPEPPEKSGKTTTENNSEATSVAPV